MSQQPLFTLAGLQTDGNLTTTEVQLDATHPIFAGHFPDNPILPGVCMLQIVKSATQLYTNKKVKLEIGQDLKFLSVISPVENPVIQLGFEVRGDGNTFNVTAKLFSDTTTFFKFKGIFTAQ